MSKKTFIPERGQTFFFVKEIIELGLPNLKIVSAKFDPSKHKDLIEKKNCFLTDRDAYNSLL